MLPMARKATVCVVDDNDLVRATMCMVLEEAGCAWRLFLQSQNNPSWPGRSAGANRPPRGVAAGVLDRAVEAFFAFHPWVAGSPRANVLRGPAMTTVFGSVGTAFAWTIAALFALLAARYWEI